MLTSNNGRRKGDRFIEFVVSELFVFIKQTFLFPRLGILPLQV